MKIPPQLLPLVEEGVVDEVIAQLKSGKEASVFLVSCGGVTRCAKVYKDAEHRGFHKLAAYQEGRKVRGSRDQRGIDNRSRHGRKQEDAAWKNAEVTALYKLAAAGVRVPAPHGVFGGVLLMEVVVDAEGRVAPRLNDVDATPEQAREWHAFLVRQIVLMLCAGVVHGDLSEYNVLLGFDGPVIIDLPQSVTASGNNSAFAMLERDVNNIRSWCGRFAPEVLETDYAREIWKLYQASELRPDSALSGRFVDESAPADLDAVLGQIEVARREAVRRQLGREAAEAGQDG